MPQPVYMGMRSRNALAHVPITLICEPIDTEQDLDAFLREVQLRISDRTLRQLWRRVTVSAADTNLMVRCPPADLPMLLHHISFLRTIAKMVGYHDVRCIGYFNQESLCQLTA